MKTAEAQTKYRMICDPGHGWLEVTASEVKRLGIDVSDYSYTKGALVYLEEDCDMAEFVKVKKLLGEPMYLTVIHEPDYSDIRRMKAYKKSGATI